MLVIGYYEGYNQVKFSEQRYVMLYNDFKKKVKVLDCSPNDENKTKVIMKETDLSALNDL